MSHEHCTYFLQQISINFLQLELKQNQHTSKKEPHLVLAPKQIEYASQCINESEHKHEQMY